MEEVSQLPVVEENVSPVTTQNKPNIVLKVLLGVVLVLAVAGYVGYNSLIKPYVVAGRAFAQLSDYDSMRINYKSDDEKVGVELDLTGTKKPAKLNLHIDELSDGQNDTLDLAGIIGEQDIFVQGKYAKEELIDITLETIYPTIKKTTTYKMLSPVWQGKSWLHLAIPKTEEAKKEEFKMDELVNTKEGKKTAWNWFWAIKPQKIEKNYKYEGDEYTKVSFGFRKERLIVAIKQLKEMDLDMKVSQINSMIKVVESSNDWDRDLVMILIDKKGDVRVVAIQIPQIEEEVLNESIAEGVGTEGNGEMIGGFATSVKDWIWGSGDMVKLGVVTFGEFDKVEEIKYPTEVVEATELLMVAQKELGPLLMQLLGGGQSSSMVAPTESSTATKTAPVATNCIQYKIREGEFASDKCYSRSDYDDLMYYIQRYNSAIATYNGEAAQANMTCNGQSEMFKQSCEESKVALQKAEADKQTYAGTIRTIIARGR